MLLQQGKTLVQAAEQTDMNVKTARKYRDSCLLPSRFAPEHVSRTRTDQCAAGGRAVVAVLQAASKMRTPRSEQQANGRTASTS